MEAPLAARCHQAAQRDEEALQGRTPLHLVVLGHVDAGKSTLMGRLLHELGWVLLLSAIVLELVWSLSTVYCDPCFTTTGPRW